MLTLTIGGSNFLPQYKTNSIDITEILQNRGNKLSIEIIKKPGENAPQEGKEIILKDGSRFLFGGFVTKVTPIEVGRGQLFIYRLEATDYTYILINKNAQKTYASQTLKYIVEDLISEYVDSGYGITTTEVETGPTIDTISFNHISLRKSFEKLAKITGFEWWIGFEKVLNFKSKQAITAPEDITDTSENHTTLSIDTDLSQVRNSIVVQGGREETSTYFSQTIEADGVAREWPLREKPTTLEYIKEDTVTQTVGEDPVDDETGNDYMFNTIEKYVRVIEADPTPIAGTEIEVSYKYEIPVIITLESASSIVAMKALEGGDGKHAHTIFESSIKSKAEARQRALKELTEYANPQINGFFTTRTGLLSAGSLFSAGQEVMINSPSWGIDTDTKYLIQEVSTTLIEDGSSIEYYYTIRFGGRLIDAIVFLESLAGKEDAVFATQEIARIEAVTEVMNISEVITRDGLKKDIAETVAISESINKINQTPPFKYGQDPDLLAHFKFDDNLPTTNVIDSSNEKDDATLLNAGNTEDISQVDASGRYLNFVSASSMNVSVPDTAGQTNFGASDSFSLSFWIKTSTAANQSISEHWEGGGAYPWALRISATGWITFGIYDGTNNPIAGNTGPQADGSWHHVVAVRNVSTGKLLMYVDKVLKHTITDTTTGSIAATSNGYSIGSRYIAGTDYFNGGIKEFRVYDKVLNLADVTNLYNDQSYNFNIPQGIWNQSEWA